MTSLPESELTDSNVLRARGLLRKLQRVLVPDRRLLPWLLYQSVRFNATYF